MENKKIFQVIIFIALALLLIIGLGNLFKGSDNLKESQKLIENIMNEVKESKKIIEKQAVTIEELGKLNKELTEKIVQVDSTNSVIKDKLDRNFYRTNKTIDDIKKTVDDIKTIDIN